jgi:N utilization substance protein B
VATPRDIRTLAFQALFQLDATEGEAEPALAEAAATDDAGAIEATLDEELVVTSGERPVTRRDRVKAVETAVAAWRFRRDADAIVRELSPEWPAHRQPAADRAVIRLAVYEMLGDGPGAGTPPKVAVNEAVELIKRFGGERSPAFVNGVLDKVLKRALAQRDTEQGIAAERTTNDQPAHADAPANAPARPSSSAHAADPSPMPGTDHA